MNEKIFSEAMGELDEKYYAEAVNYKKKRSGTPLKRIAVVAACLCVAVFGFVLGAGSQKPSVNPSNSDVSTDVAQTVKFNGETYFVCGSGEAEILKECGLPQTLDSSLAGKHVSYLRFEESRNEFVFQNEEKGSAGELFEYAKKPNKNVYIIALGEKYYAAIRHDENGYHYFSE
ncbi:MAG: hypothetical protein Q4D20_06010 [Clostridia bacterium]|nr:hypothetical protein [Clostridia bacterium]